jgi:ribosomal protein L37AE/L43A
MTQFVMNNMNNKLLAINILRRDEQKCLNTYGACSNSAINLSYFNGYSTQTTYNFCSEECRLKYRGEFKNKRVPRKQKWIVPPRGEWIVTIDKLTYVYDPWEQKYYMYKLGAGLLNDLDTIVADENSEYYRTLLDIISRDLPVPQQPNKPFPKKYNQLVALGIDAKTISQMEKKLPANHYVCHVCGKVLIVTGGVATNLLLCPRCNWDIKGKGYERYVDRQTGKQVKQQSTSSKRFRKQKRIKSRRQTNEPKLCC